MKPDKANSQALELVGNDGHPSAQEVLTTSLKRWRRTLAYCSIFSTVPAALASHVLADTPKKPQALYDEPNKEEAIFSRRSFARFQRLNKNFSKPALLKRQSAFRFSQQQDKFDLQAALGGTDDCPGRQIPGGTYTAAVPFTDVGDTTNANSTVSRVFYYYYYSFDTIGPDHIYSFMLTSRGPNPQIQVSATSPAYRPLIYVLSGGPGLCPAGTNNQVFNAIISAGSDNNGVATLSSQLMNFLPLDVPLHLFIDSNSTGPDGKGGYSIRMQDVTVPSPCPNPVDCAGFFVRQHYLDFLGREPDPEGLKFWTNEITSCGSDPQCAELKRINVSAAFFLSIEFQESGYLVYRMYKAAFGALPPEGLVPLTRQEFLPDTQRVGQGVVVGKAGWEQQLLNNKNAFANEFVTRQRFTNAYPGGTSPEQFVDTLNTNTGGVLSQSKRNQLVNELATGLKTRAQVLRAVAEDADFARNEFNKAFVLMQYFGYLHRNPNDAPDGNLNGYIFWLIKLNQFNGNFIEAEMVKAFIDSIEYRQRFAL